MRFKAILIALTILVASPTHAEDQPGQIVVTGRGFASAPADKATLRIEVVANARKSELAMEQITISSDTVMAALRNYGVSEADIETTSLSVGEDWQYEEGTRVFAGYSARTNLIVDVRDLSRLGNLVATLSRDNAISVNGPHFDIEDKVTLRNEARRNAVRDGLETAELLASAAGVTLGPPLLITDGTEPTERNRLNAAEQIEEPMVMEEPVMEDFGEISETGVDVIPGEIERTETVKLIFRIEP